MKYYTPSLDEFHHNFEYKSRSDNNEHVYLTKDIDLLDTQVKYLDDDDIRSLGFKLEKSYEDVNVYFKQVISTNSVDYVELYFYVEHGEPYVRLESSNGEIILSDLNVKNKYELSWLLTRYGMV